jgi:hypothetical protein
MEGTVIFSDLAPRRAFRRAQSSLIVPQMLASTLMKNVTSPVLSAIAFSIKKKRRSEM